MFTNVLAIKYENILFGKYWHGGVTTVKDPSGNTVKIIPYYTSISTAESKVWKLKTKVPWDVIVNGYSDQTITKAGGELKVTLDGTNVIINYVTVSNNMIKINELDTFNNSKLLQDRGIYLNYKCQNDSATSYAKDTLTFRNRLQDGVNIWQYEIRHTTTNSEKKSRRCLQALLLYRKLQIV